METGIDENGNVDIMPGGNSHGNISGYAPRSNWQDAMDKIPDKGWRLGKGEREWLADLKWFLRNDEVIVELMEE